MLSAVYKESTLSARGPYQQNQGDDRQAGPTKARLYYYLEGQELDKGGGRAYAVADKNLLAV